MATHIDEEEQVESIKRWLRENGAALVAGLVIGLGAVGGWEGWKRWTEHTAQQATTVYDELQKAVDGKDEARITELGDRLVADFASTPYASAAQLLRARSAVDAQRYDEAAERLRWVVERSDDEGLTQLAALRLARVLWQQDKADEALAGLIDSGPYAGLTHELRGDIERDRGNDAAARTAYQQALEHTEAAAPTRELLQQKLDDLAMPAVTGEAS